MRKVTSPTARTTLTTLLSGVLVAASLSVIPLVTSTASASAAEPKAPGNHTGYGFDACVAPSQKVMDAWRLYSPYKVVGIYTSGNSRYCGDKYQPNLTPTWVKTNAAKGWSFLPIHVGYQSPCFKNNPRSRVQKKLMSRTLSTARSQGRSDGLEAARAMKKYGFGYRAVGYLDLEWYPRTTACDNAVLAFTDGFNDAMHGQGFHNGVYSSGSAVIKLLDEVRRGKKKPPSGFTQPEYLWFAWTNKKADLDGGPYLDDKGWTGHRRIHQFHNGVDESYGGYKVNIDRNYMDVGTGSVTKADAKQCGLSLTLSSYPGLKTGSRNAAVKVAQCLLTRRGHTVRTTGLVGAGTVKAINAYRRSKGWPQTGTVTATVWTALLAEGSRPAVLKHGDVGEPVWRLQRALRGARCSGIRTTGRYDRATETCVKAYRKAQGSTAYPTVTANLWTTLQAGRQY